jgi:hypothetical protein
MVLDAIVRLLPGVMGKEASGGPAITPRLPRRARIARELNRGRGPDLMRKLGKPAKLRDRAFSSEVDAGSREEERVQTSSESPVPIQSERKRL